MCVHTRHCTYQGCKYGEEDYCPVYLGYKSPEVKVDEEGYEVEKPSEEEFDKRRSVAEQNDPFHD